MDETLDQMLFTPFIFYGLVGFPATFHSNNNNNFKGVLFKAIAFKVCNVFYLYMTKFSMA